MAKSPDSPNEASDSPSSDLPEDHRLAALVQAVRELTASEGAATQAALGQRLGLPRPALRKLLNEVAWTGLVIRARVGRSFIYMAAAPAQVAPTPALGPAPALGPLSSPAPPPPAGEIPEPATTPGKPAVEKPAPLDPRRRLQQGAPVEGEEGDGFLPSDLDYMVISLPLAELLEALESRSKKPALPADFNRKVGETIARFDVREGDRVSVIVDLNKNFVGGLGRARHRLYDLLVRLGYTQEDQRDLTSDPPGGPAAQRSAKTGSMLNGLSPRGLRGISAQYVFALLTPPQIRELVALERRRAPRHRSIYRLWPDNIVQTQTFGSAAIGALATIKADAARATFGCAGHGVVWAVVDSGIDSEHPHFRLHNNLGDLPPGVEHVDLTSPEAPRPLTDRYGHGTHVAGIIAGALEMDMAAAAEVTQIVYERDPQGRAVEQRQRLDQASGVAPATTLVSYKVLRDNGQGPVTNVIAALEAIFAANGHGRNNRVHGVNLSVGYPFEPRWFACGQSPLCEVVDRLVRSGVVVVAAAGNNGYALTDLGSAGVWGQGRGMSITDPGNAERAITVGSTHRDAPHTYGVSYFSSKGPTGDGRSKPDVLAPGEKIVSCASGQVNGRTPGAALYREDSGTSMAAPHVSGAIAAFLSVRREFIGRTDAIKALFLESALDLKRAPEMQGRGLIDLFRALQSV